MKNQADVIVIGAGHNGLVAALMLARKKLEVLVLFLAGSTATGTRPAPG